QVTQALYAAGAGNIGNYSNCSFSSIGKGTFTPNENATPVVGSPNREEIVDENRIEVVFPTHLQHQITTALKESHPYEEVAYYISELQNYNQEIGSGIIAELEKPMTHLTFLDYLKTKMNLTTIRHTRYTSDLIKRIAICGGSGSFLLAAAKKANADVFITADFKYHEFFDAEDELMICDIGHYESEVYTKDLIFEILNKKFTTFALCLSEVNTNPISYF
ncbi:MAG: Nif3-like dinuclear metal center hexameric protein, partial [Cyclobacteriaceae bacterium]|nr:Nif3-like dinuclear metal center hexameric protein [Cyclobacteriaceae bacterium]